MHRTVTSSPSGRRLAAAAPASASRAGLLVAPAATAGS